MRKLMLTALVLSVAVDTSTFAQTEKSSPAVANETPAAVTATDGGDTPSQQSPNMASGQSAETAGPFVTIPETGTWRVTQLEGKAVYGAENESIGEIDDVLVSADGSITAVIIGVGGFLGIAEKSVAVDMSALHLGPGANQQQADAANAEVSPETTVYNARGLVPSGDAATTNNIEIDESGLPERIVLNVTRQQLEAAPAFEGVKAAPN